MVVLLLLLLLLFVASTTASPVASPDNTMDSYDFEVAPNGEILLIPKKRFITKRFTADKITDLKIPCRAFEEDEAKYKAEKE